MTITPPANENDIFLNPANVTNAACNSLEAMAAWLYGLPEHSTMLDRDHLLAVQMAAERMETRLDDLLDWLARETGRRRK
jgi:hypothetical protein